MTYLDAREKRNLMTLVILGSLPLGLAAIFGSLETDPNIQIPQRAPLPVPNGFDLYVNAAGLTRQPNPPVDATSDPSSASISAAQGALRYGQARRQTWHQGAAPGWAVFDAAQATPTRDPYPPGAAMMPGYARLRQLARNKIAETNLFKMRGETGRAVQSGLDSVQMGLDTAQDGALISRLVSAAIVAIGLSPLNDLARVPEKLSAADARAATSRLEALIARRPSWSEALQNERWMALALFKQAIEKGNWRAPDAFTFGMAPTEETPGDTVMRRFTSKRTVAAHINAAFDHAIAAQNAPYVPNAPDFALDSDPISRPLVPTQSQRFNQAREKTQLDLMLLRFALRAYRLENGQFPPTLDALKGRYLQRIPRDDFAGGKPYRYVVKNGNYRLWSVGPDAVDDGGKAIVGRGFPGTPLPWQKSLPSMLPDSTGDVVAGEVR